MTPEGAAERAANLDAAREYLYRAKEHAVDWDTNASLRTVAMALVGILQVLVEMAEDAVDKP